MNVLGRVKKKKKKKKKRGGGWGWRLPQNPRDKTITDTQSLPCLLTVHKSCRGKMITRQSDLFNRFKLSVGLLLAFSVNPSRKKRTQLFLSHHPSSTCGFVCVCVLPVSTDIIVTLCVCVCYLSLLISL